MSESRAASLARLERDLLAATMNDVRECRRIGYDPHIFLDMIHRHRIVEACRRVVMELPANQAPYGFGRLWELGRLDLTVETAMGRERWFPLFGDDVRERAAARLRHFEPRT